MTMDGSGGIFLHYTAHSASSCAWSRSAQASASHNIHSSLNFGQVILPHVTNNNNSGFQADGSQGA